MKEAEEVVEQDDQRLCENDLLTHPDERKNDTSSSGETKREQAEQAEAKSQLKQYQREHPLPNFCFRVKIFQLLHDSLQININSSNRCDFFAQPSKLIQIITLHLGGNG